MSFFTKSSKQHGIHSPFVFDLTRKCLHQSKPKEQSFIEQINDFRNSLLSNKNFIEVTDFGAGSRVFKSNKRLISAIAKNAGISKKRGILLFNIVSYFKPKQILEIGTSLGIATSCMSIGNPNAHIITLEGCPETAKIAKDQFNAFHLSNIETYIGEFEKTLSKVIQHNKFDLIYFDGNHQKEATINYFEKCLSSSHNESLFIFDDIHWNKEMEQAWEYIKNHKRVSISIDTYQWGMIFFRKEQKKEHFLIRV